MSAIDVVIAWVDGSDPRHSARRRQFEGDASASHKAATEQTRFADSGEIYILLASILKYAPYIRKVHVIADGQQPALLDAFQASGLCAPSFIEMVDHRRAFEGLPAALPTFNSLSIEAAIWNIGGLAEHFIYCNDDFFFNAPTTSADFFDAGRPVLRGDVVRTSRSTIGGFARRLAGKLFTEAKLRPSFRIAQEKGAELAGQTGRYMQIGHHPHALRRGTLSDFYAANPEVLHDQLSYRFRNIAQHSPVSLANHLEIERFGVEPGPRKPVIYLKPGRPLAPILDAIDNETHVFGCIQSEDEFDHQTRKLLRECMLRKFAAYLPPEVISHLQIHDSKPG